MSNGKNGWGMFRRSHHLSLKVGLTEMRTTGRDVRTGAPMPRYHVALMIQITASGREPVQLQRCEVFTGTGETIPLLTYSGDRGRVAPGEPPLRLALDATKLRQQKAQHIDLIDVDGGRWSVGQRTLSRKMASYEDHAAIVEQLNAAARFSVAWATP